jgi:hypothetical protein
MLMNKDLFFDGKEYISASRASKKLGYSQDYIGELIRKEKVPGKMIGRTWYVELESLLEHKKSKKVKQKKSENKKQDREKSRNPVYSLNEISPILLISRTKLKYGKDDAPVLPVIQKAPRDLWTLRKKVIEDTLIGFVSVLIIVASGLHASGYKAPEFTQNTLDKLAQVSDMEDRMFASVGSAFDAGKEIAKVPVVHEISISLGAIRDLIQNTFFYDPKPEVPSRSLVIVPETNSKPTVQTAEKPAEIHGPVQTAMTTYSLSQFDIESLKNDLRAEFKDYVEGYSGAGLSTVNYYFPTTQLETFRTVEIAKDISHSVRSQGTSDVDSISTIITNILNGGTFKNSDISGAVITDSSFEGANVNITGSLSAENASTTSMRTDSLTFLNATGTNATTTNFFSTNGHFDSLFAGTLSVNDGDFTVGSQLNLIQSANGLTQFYAKRATDLAPSGDFITYYNAAGDTALFRVDNSGNIYSGGITNSGSLTVTSVSTPQFRVQYDSLNEVTTSVSSAGAVAFGVNGSTPRISWAPQSDRTDTFQFQDSSGLSLLNVDTLNKRVTIPDFLFTNATGTNATTTNFFSTTASSTSLFASLLAVAGNGLVVDASGNVGVGTTSPLVSLSIGGTDALKLPSGTTLERPSLLNTEIGDVRYNTTLHQFEGYGDNSVWQGLGGVIDADQDTKITADTASADEDVLRFFTTGSERMTILANGNVGVGSTTPYAKLSIKGSGTTTGVNFQTTNSSNSPLFTILDSGNVGVGIANPTSKIDVDGRVTADSFTIFDNGCAGSVTKNGVGNTGDFSISSCVSGSLRIGSIPSNLQGSLALTSAEMRFVHSGATGGGMTISSWGDWGSSMYPLDIWENSIATSRILAVDAMGALGWADGTTGAVDAKIYRSAASTIRTDSNFIVDGNVGIGTTSPGMKLNVAGDVRLRDSGADTSLIIGADTGFSEKIGIQNNGSDIAQLFFSGGSSYFDYQGALDFRRGINGSSSLYLSSGGSIGIGTTNPSVNLHIYSTGRTSQIIDTSGNSDTDLKFRKVGVAEWIMGRRDSDGSFYINPGAALSGLNGITIKTDGNVGIGTTTPSAKLAITGTSGTGDIFAIASSTNARLLTVTNGGNVGIGIATPISTLTVKQATGVSGSGITLMSNDDDSQLLLQKLASPDIFRIAATYGTTGSYKPLAFYTSDVERLRIDTGGNVGIGTASPTAYPNFIGLSIGDNSVSKTGFLKFKSTYNSGDGAEIYQNTSGTFNINTNSSLAALSILSGGNVGIGTTTPQTKLDVDGDSIIGRVQSSSGAGAAVVYNEDATSYVGFQKRGTAATGNLSLPAGASEIVSTISPLGIYTTGLNYLALGTNNTERMRIDSSGNVGIGVSTTLNQKLEVAGSILLQNNNNLYFKNAAGSGAGGWSINPIVGGNFQIKEESLGITPFVINQSGNIGIGTSTPSATLDVTGASTNTGFFRTSSTDTVLTNLNGGLLNLQNTSATNNNAVGALFRDASGTAVSAILNQTTSHTSHTGALNFLTNDGTSIKNRMTVGSDGNLYLNDEADVAHGITAQLPTGSYGKFAPLTTTGGGLNIVGISDAASTGGLQLAGLIGSTDPTDSVPAVLIETGKKGTTNGDSLGAAETVFRINNWGTNMLTILGSGSVGIGTVTPSSSFKLDVNGAIQAVGNINLSYNSGQVSIQSGVGRILTEDATGVFVGALDNSSRPILFSAGGTTRAVISTAGSIKFNAYGAGTLTTDASGNITASSDERLKNIQGEFTRGLADLRGIKPISYKWNTTSGYDQIEIYSGFSAQNVQANIPEAIGIDPRGYLTLSDRPITAALVNGVKELDVRTASTTIAVAGLRLDFASTASSVDDLLSFASTTNARLDANELRISDLEAVFANASSSQVGLILDATTTDAVADSYLAAASTGLKNGVKGLGAVIVRIYDSAIYATSGIFDKIFARSVHTDLICLSDEGGETCITKSNLDTILTSSGSSGMVNTISTSSTDSVSSTSNTDSTSTTSGDSTTSTTDSSTPLTTSSSTPVNTDSSGATASSTPTTDSTTSTSSGQASSSQATDTTASSTPINTNSTSTTSGDSTTLTTGSPTPLTTSSSTPAN